MTTFIIGAISGIAVSYFLCFLISKMENIKIKKEIGKDYDYEMVMKPKDINRDVTICLNDDECTNVDLDKDNNIIAFIDFHEANVKLADFYESLFTNRQVITIDYNLQMYKTIITQIKLINENKLRIYYTVIDIKN